MQSCDHVDRVRKLTSYNQVWSLLLFSFPTDVRISFMHHNNLHFSQSPNVFKRNIYYIYMCIVCASVKGYCHWIELVQRANIVTVFCFFGNLD